MFTDVIPPRCEFDWGVCRAFSGTVRCDVERKDHHERQRLNYRHDYKLCEQPLVEGKCIYGH